MKKLSALILAVLMLMSVMAGCVTTPDPTSNPNVNVNPTTGGDPTDPTNTEPAGPVITPHPEGDFIWKTSASVMPANWNPHTYQDSTDAIPLDYTTSSLYSFIFNDELHPVEGKEPFEGYYIMPDMALEYPIDVTEEIKAAYPQFNIPEDIDKGYAYKIVLNPAVCWDDGTPINAQTYVDSFYRLLDPKLLNYRAADWYGQALSIVGAEYYAMQGRTKYTHECGLELANLTLTDGAYYDSEGNPIYIVVQEGLDNWLRGNSLEAYVNAYGESVFSMTYWADLVAACNADGYAPLTPDTLTWILDVITGNPEWGETEADLTNYLAWGSPYPETFAWEDVGVLATGEYELTLVLDKSLAGFDLLYNMSGVSNVLVKADLYDANLKCEVGASGEEIWSSTYGTSLETSVSFGPYKMSAFQSDKVMHFIRNNNWWGYTDGKHIYMDPEDGCVYNFYQTTEIDIQWVKEASTTKNMFFAGQLMSYGLQADDFATLRQSDYCYATPAATIYFLILNGHKEAIEQRENAEDFDKATQDLQMLSNTTFHKAVGLSYDKDHFAATISPARSGALGIIGTPYIYDPDTGARYRDTDQAKMVLCEFYGVDVSKYDSLDDAVDSITGYNPDQAKVLFAQAFQEGLELGYINDEDGDGKCDQMIRIEYVMSTDPNEFMTSTINYMNENIAKATQGTPFEGKIEFFMGANVGNEWTNMIRNGMSDTVLGGWDGSLLDPFGLTDLYTNPEKQYDAGWFDATKTDVTINVPVNGENKDVTLSLRQWSLALNGTAVEKDGVTYNYGSGQADVEVRLDILAACELAILQTYDYLPMLQNGSMALLTQQVYYVIEEYNPIMGRGGLAYTKYNYNEEAWAAYVESQDGTLQY